MDYLKVYHFLAERLAIPALEIDDPEVLPDSTPSITPIVCTSFEDLKKHVFVQREGEIKLEHIPEIEQTIAAVAATVLSTTTTGGQVGLRVIGDPGSAKSTIAECFSCFREMVYPKSIFTGIVSGWSTIRRGQSMAAKLNGMCLMVKDSDTMYQLPNIRQIQSQLRDALGDGVIRAEYMTGREFEIYTIFTCVLYGTSQLRLSDDSSLGERFLDINIHAGRPDTKLIVRRAIRSQFTTIAEQVAKGINYNPADSSPHRKKIILNLAPAIVGFMQHKLSQLKTGFHVNPLTEAQEEQLHAMGELVSILRVKIKRSKTGEIAIRPRREFATRLGELFTRLGVFLGFVLQEGPVTVGEKEFSILKKILMDTINGEGYQYSILEHIYREGQATQSELVISQDLSASYISQLVNDMKETGVLTTKKVKSFDGRGNQRILYRLTEDVRALCDQTQLIPKPTTRIPPEVEVG